MSSVDHDRDLEVLTYTAAVERITACLAEHVDEVTRPMKILEAGCGRRWEIDLERTDYELTGVDLDSQALDFRRSVAGDLDLAVVGNICDRDVVPSNHFDVIYSSYVLEHIEVARNALENFLEWSCPGGLIVMLLPNRDSVYCWAARLTPYRLHEWVYRYVFRSPRREAHSTISDLPRPGACAEFPRRVLSVAWPRTAGMVCHRHLFAASRREVCRDSNGHALSQPTVTRSVIGPRSRSRNRDPSPAHVVGDTGSSGERGTDARRRRTCG